MEKLIVLTMELMKNIVGSLKSMNVPRMNIDVTMDNVSKKHMSTMALDILIA
jgi:hypothetical protein